MIGITGCRKATAFNLRTVAESSPSIAFRFSASSGVRVQWIWKKKPASTLPMVALEKSPEVAL